MNRHYRATSALIAREVVHVRDTGRTNLHNSSGPKDDRRG